MLGGGGPGAWPEAFRADPMHPPQLASPFTSEATLVVDDAAQKMTTLQVTVQELEHRHQLGFVVDDIVERSYIPVISSRAKREKSP
ncbi:hypothetical protein PG984_006545 [Apiospora sp. TS-2023a]